MLLQYLELDVQKTNFMEDLKRSAEMLQSLKTVLTDCNCASKITNMHFNEQILANTATMNPADKNVRQIKQVSQQEKNIQSHKVVFTDVKSPNTQCKSVKRDPGKQSAYT